MRYVLALAALLVVTQASAAERRMVYEFVGFAEDGEHFVVEKYDYNVGWSFSVRALVDGTHVKSFPFDDGNKKRVLKKVSRKYKLKEGDGPKSPDGRFVLLGAKDGKYLDVLVMDKPRIGRFKDIPLKLDKKKKPMTEAIMKKGVWSPDGKWVVVIMNEKLPGDTGWEEDKVFSWKFRKWKVKWFREEKKEGE